MNNIFCLLSGQNILMDAICSIKSIKDIFWVPEENLNVSQMSDLHVCGPFDGFTFCLNCHV